MKYGYARVSTDDQSAALQFAALKRPDARRFSRDEGLSGARPSARHCSVASRLCAPSPDLKLANRELGNVEGIGQDGRTSLKIDGGRYHPAHVCRLLHSLVTWGAVILRISCELTGNAHPGLKPALILLPYAGVETPASLRNGAFPQLVKPYPFKARRTNAGSSDSPPQRAKTARRGPGSAALCS